MVLREEDRGRVGQLPFILMHSPLGINVPLDELVRFDSGLGPSEIRRVAQERTFQVFAKIYERSLKEVTEDLQRGLDQMAIHKGYAATIAGESLEVQESFNSMRLALILSLILVYMVMAAQFESYFQPFIIMFTVPVAMIGVAIALGITGTAISVVVILGIILMAGIVVNNGILLIDFMNHMIQKGTAVRDAVVQAGTVRYRPILMTALTTVLGLLPLALGLGEGSKLQSPMAKAVMGGLLAGAFLTLLVIPAIFEATYKFRKPIRKEKTPDAVPQEG